MQDSLKSTGDFALVERILELGGASAKVNSDGDKPFAIVPDGCKAISMADYFPPTRIKRQVTLLEAGSFADYVNKFKSPNTLIFAVVSETGVTFKAMLDYHNPAPDLKPAYCEHIAVFSAIETPEWKTWRDADRQVMSQVEFATWIEDNAKLFVEPDGADLLELIRSLHGHQNARFNQAIRLDNGAFSVGYDEDVVVKSANVTKAGSMELPPVLKAGISVFQGSTPYEVAARLKSRVSERQLKLFFETIAKHEIVRESIMLLVKQISEATTIIPLLGNP